MFFSGGDENGMNDVYRGPERLPFSDIFGVPAGYVQDRYVPVNQTFEKIIGIY
jgi:hypothetical protein